MKIADVRALLNKYTKEQLRIIIAEMYKATPKKIKEEKNFDYLITNVDDLKKPGTRRKKKEPAPDMDELIFEAEEFIEYAYKQYYFAPNSFVHKNQRPKWRFIAKRLYKNLLEAAANKADLPSASELLEKLYVLLCYSCGRVLFSGYDSFNSVQIEQPVFYHSVLSLKVRHETHADFVKGAISLVVDNELNRYTLHTDLMNVAFEFFKTPDLKELAVETCENMLNSFEKPPPREKGRSMRRGRWGDFYKLRYKINHLSEFGFLCCARLYEFDRGIRLFTSNYQGDGEVLLYVLLKLLFSCGQKELMLREYQKALKKGVTPRDQLVKLIKGVKKTGELPKSFYGNR